MTHAGRRRSLHGYVSSAVLMAFTLVVVTLTLLVWLVQVLKDFELVTSQAKSIVEFVAMTSLIIPALVLVIAPIALVAATLFVGQRLQSDSELVVMAAAGFSPWRIFRPFLSAALVVAVLVAVISSYVAPKLLRDLRLQIMEARSNLFVTVMQPGRFQTIGGHLTFHLRERRPDGSLVHVLIDDRRNPDERVTITAETAQLAQTDNRTFLIFYDGSLQRLKRQQLDPSIVEFKQYAFDMTDFAAVRTPVFNVTERYVWDLINPDPSDSYYTQNVERFRVELHERILAPLYPVLFVFVVFAVIGMPRTTRQNRIGGVLIAIGAVGALRLGAHSLMIAAVKSPELIPVVYAILGAGAAICVSIIAHGTAVPIPAALNRVGQSMARLATPTINRIRRRFLPQPG